MKFIDITGQKFGRLTALYKMHNHHDKKNSYWICICDCGNFLEARSQHLRNNSIKSCGCLHKEIMSTHGKHDTRLYRIWVAMKQRCNNPNNESYKYYGERGIKVCDEWRKDFMVFYNWAMNNGYNDNLTIDRINVDGNYEPANCRWITYQEQARNTRKTKNITINGETHCLKDWCKILNLNYNTVRYRLNVLKLSIKEALEFKEKNND